MDVSTELARSAGIEEMSVDSEAGFHAAVAAQVGRERTPEPTAEERVAEREYDLHAPGEEIRNLMIHDDDPGTDVHAALDAASTLDDDSPSESDLGAETERLREADPAWDARAKLRDLEAKELELLRQYESDTQGTVALENALDQFGVYHEGDLAELSEDQRTALAKTWTSLSPSVRQGLLEGDALGEDAAARLDWISEAVDSAVNAIRAKEASDRAREQNLAQSKQLIGRWQHERNLTADQARARIAAAGRLAESHGIDLDTLAVSDPQAALDHLAAADEVAQGARRATATRVFQQSIIDVPGYVAEGLEVFDPSSGRWVAPNRVDLTAEHGPQPIDIERVARRATPMSADEIRAGIFSADSEAAISREIQQLAARVWDDESRTGR